MTSTTAAGPSIAINLTLVIVETRDYFGVVVFAPLIATAGQYILTRILNVFKLKRSRQQSECPLVKPLWVLCLCSLTYMICMSHFKKSTFERSAAAVKNPSPSSILTRPSFKCASTSPKPLSARPDGIVPME